MITVCIARDTTDQTTWQTYHVDNIHDLLVDEFPDGLPGSARIYHEHVAFSHDVTPTVPEDVERLGKLGGKLYVMVYPRDPLTIGIIIAVVLAVVSIAVTFLFRPSSPKASAQTSPNNSLADRQNSSRPNERIPDIVGDCRAVPDLIMAPYKVFEFNNEVEYADFVVGRGSYTVQSAGVNAGPGGVNLLDVRDDTTPVQFELGASVAVYGPGTSPNNGATPQLQIGPLINAPVLEVHPCSAVTGQVLRPNNTYSVTGDNNIFATSDGTFQTTDDSIDFSASFAENDTLFVEAFMTDQLGNAYDLSGTYIVIAAGTGQVVLANPAAVNANWNSFVGSGENGSPTMSTPTDHYIGPFVLNYADIAEVWFNLIAPQGLYKVSSSSGNQFRIDVDVQAEITALGADGQPSGSPYIVTGVVTGSAILQSQRAATIKVALPRPGACQVRLKRTNPTDLTWVGANMDSLQWRDLYAVVYPTVNDYGDVTMVQTKTIATASALTVNSRKLNMLVTRNLPSFANPALHNNQADTTVVTPPDPTVLQPTNNIADIIVALARDPFIGNCADSDIDFQTIYALLGPPSGDAVSEVEAYFGTPLVTQYGYTFDDANVSFEEMLQDIGQAINCTFYRRGRLLSVFFERTVTTGAVLFNHRNKVPDSEQRTETFGYTSDYDGIEIQYIDPNAPNYPDIDTQVTLYFPPDQSAINAKQVQLLGCRNNVQAWFVGWRLYQKLIYQNTAVEFTTFAEASPLINNQAIVVADDTRGDTIDGDVIDIDGLILTARLPLVLQPAIAYSIYLQLVNGQVDLIPVSQTVVGSNQMLLGRAPAAEISVAADNWANATFYIAAESDVTPTMFLLSEKDPMDNQQNGIKAINYDDRYYAHDTDFKTGVIVPNEPPANSGIGYYPAIPVKGGGYVYIIGGIQSNNVPVSIPDSFDISRSLNWATVAEAYNSGDTIVHGVFSAGFTGAAPFSTCRDGGDNPPFGQTSNWMLVLWTADATVVGISNPYGSGISFTSANNDDMCFMSLKMNSGSTMIAPDGFTNTNMLAMAGPCGMYDIGIQAHGVAACSVSGSGLVTVTYNDENENFATSGSANVLAFYFTPAQGVGTLGISNGLALIIPAGGGNCVSLSLGRVDNGGTLGFVPGANINGAIAAASGQDDAARDHRWHGILDCNITSVGVGTCIYADGDMNKWNGWVNGCLIGYGRLPSSYVIPGA